MTEKKRGITYRVLLMFFLCTIMFLSRPTMESRADIHKEANGVVYNYFYSTNGGTRVVITSVHVPTGITSVSVPEKINGYPVVAIGASHQPIPFAGAFSQNPHLLSVTLPDSVCEIYERAFENLTKLQTISLNGDGIVIGYKAFKGCNNLKVTFRGAGAVKYISGYAFWTTDSNCLDYNVIKNRVNKDSWIGYDATWNNEAEWKALVNSLTPFKVAVEDDPNRDWKPTFDELTPDNGYPNPNQQIVSASTYTNDYKAWIRKSAKWVDSEKVRAEIRLDVAYNPISSKSENDMVFVLDVSGSMFFANSLIPGSNYSRQFQTFDQVRSVGKALLDLNENGIVYNRVGATMFDNRLRGTSRSATGATDGFFTDYASFIKWLDQENYIYNGATGYSFGLDGATELIKNRSNKSRTPSVIFLSDGAPNRGTEGSFPGTSITGHGGSSTKALSDLGVTRYCIMLGNINEKVENKTYTALEAITYIAGVPDASNDSTRTYASPDAATLQQAFQEILVQLTENLSLSLSDTAGEYFDVDAIPTATGGGVSKSGVSTSWDLSGTSPRQVYTLIIIQELKRNSNDHNAFFYGENMRTNLGDAILEDAFIGKILSVGSPALSKSLGKFTVNVHVDNGFATGLDGRESSEISDTITETGTYTARYRGHFDAVLESIEVAAYGETKKQVSIESNSNFYAITDIRCDYDIWVVYLYPLPSPGTWSYRATVENGSIAPERGDDIPVGKDGGAIKYSPEDGYVLAYILIGQDDQPKRKLSISDQVRYSEAYSFIGKNPDVVHIIHVVYSEIPAVSEEKKEREEIWEDYRR